MDFALSAEQEELAATVRSLLAKHGDASAEVPARRAAGAR